MNITRNINMRELNMKRFWTAIAICALMAASSGMVNAQANATDILGDKETGDFHIDEQLRQELRWSGFYVGAGGVFGATVTELSDGGNSIDGLGGEGAGLMGQVGYDQRLGRFIVGVGVDFTYSDDFWQTDLDGVEINREHDWTAYGRLGVLLNPNTMSYILLGYSQLQVGEIGPTPSKTFDGYTVGGGVETKVNDFVSAFAEGRWSQYDSESYGHIEAEPSEAKAMMGLRIKLLTE